MHETRLQSMPKFTMPPSTTYLNNIEMMVICVIGLVMLSEKGNGNTSRKDISSLNASGTTHART